MNDSDEGTGDMNDQLMTDEQLEADAALSGSRAGFSLVEVLVAMVMLAVVVMSLARMTTLTAQRSIGMGNATARQAFALQETNRLAAVPYDSLNAKAGCDTLSTGSSKPFKFNRCISIVQGTRYREVTLIVTPIMANTFADTIVFRRVIGAAPNPLNLP